MEEDNIGIEYDLNKLAYLGDAIFELYTRRKLYDKYNNSIDMNKMHQMNTKLVCAKSQSIFVDRLLKDNILTNDEIIIFKSGRNLHSNSKSKNSPIRDYRKATGLEALIGYLYINNKLNRILDILSLFNID